MSVTVSAVQLEKRLEICRGCEKFQIVPVLKAMQCAACGCILAAKARLTGSTCPLGKWPLY